MASETMAEVMTTSPSRVKDCRSYTPEEAKARFVVAASRLSLGRVIQTAPWKSVGLALASGILLGYSHPLRRGLVKLGKLSVKGVITIITHLWPSPLAEPETSTVSVEDTVYPSRSAAKHR